MCTSWATRSREPNPYKCLFVDSMHVLSYYNLDWRRKGKLNISILLKKVDMNGSQTSLPGQTQTFMYVECRRKGGRCSDFALPFCQSRLAINYPPHSHRRSSRIFNLLGGNHQRSNCCWRAWKHRPRVLIEPLVYSWFNPWSHPSESLTNLSSARESSTSAPRGRLGLP